MHLAGRRSGGRSNRNFRLNIQQGISGLGKIHRYLFAAVTNDHAADQRSTNEYHWPSKPQNLDRYRFRPILCARMIYRMEPSKL